MASARVALVIGNANYVRAPKLAKPIGDAWAVADKFATIGFQTYREKNLGLGAIRAAFKELREHAAGAEIAALYYAGHGIEVSGENYLVPIDAKLANPTTIHDVEDEVFALARVLEAASEASSLRLIILDCCRDNPFRDSITRSLRGATRGFKLHRGLGTIAAPPGNSLIAYAAAAGEVAYDGDTGDKHSPFAQALLDHLGTPGLDVQQVFPRVRNSVIGRTRTSKDGKPQPPQTPHWYVGIDNPDIFLAGDVVETEWQRSNPPPTRRFSTASPNIMLAILAPRILNARRPCSAMRRRARRGIGIGSRTVRAGARFASSCGHGPAAPMPAKPRPASRRSSHPGTGLSDRQPR